ncbi:hypothetical protein D3C71_1955080 [compost metagenome]
MLLARLARGKDRDARQRPPQLVRAIENFKMALRLKMAGDGETALSAAQVDRIAALLDEVALKIEKV